MRWECFGECGGWGEWFKTAETKKEVLRLSIAEMHHYKSGYLRDNETSEEWLIQFDNNKWTAECYFIQS